MPCELQGPKEKSDGFAMFKPVFIYIHYFWASSTSLPVTFSLSRVVFVCTPLKKSLFSFCEERTLLHYGHRAREMICLSSTFLVPPFSPLAFKTFQASRFDR